MVYRAVNQYNITPPIQYKILYFNSEFYFLRIGTLFAAKHIMRKVI